MTTHMYNDADALTDAAINALNSEVARRLVLDYKAENSEASESFILKINHAIYDHASRGITFLRVMDALDMKRPSVAQWSALRDHYMGRGFDWDAGSETNEMTGITEPNLVRISW